MTIGPKWSLSNAYPAFVFLAIAVAATPIAAQSRSNGQSQSPYTRREIDAKLDAMRGDILAHLPPKNADTASKSELDSKISALKQQIDSIVTSSDGWQKNITKDLATTSDSLKTMSADLKAVSLRVAKVEGQIPSMPPWVAVLISVVVSILIAGFGAFISYRIANRNLAVTNANRAEDRANSLIEQWEEMDPQIEQALTNLADPANLADERLLSDLRKVGNLYDKIGREWRNGNAKAETIVNHGLMREARRFWEALTQAQQTLAQSQSATSLDRFIQSWMDLRRFAA